MDSSLVYSPPNHNRMRSVLPPHLFVPTEKGLDSLPHIYQSLDAESEESEDYDENANVGITGWTKLDDEKYYNIYTKTTEVKNHFKVKNFYKNLFCE
jgi:hypothetical protein